MRRGLRAVGWFTVSLIYAALLVLLVPSSAWADGTAPLPPSPSSSPSEPSEPPQTVEPETPEPSSSEPSSPSESSLSESSSPSGEPSLLEEPADPSGCGHEGEPPCVVVLEAETTALIALGLGLLVALSAASLVSSWGRDG